MQCLIDRFQSKILGEYLDQFPVVALLGPRQCGKSTLAKTLIHPDKCVYLDLERPSDLAKLSDPELFFRHHQTHLVIIDEIHHAPNLFAVMRSIVDQTARPGQILVLGSASDNLLNQSAESLAGRIGYIELTPFFYPEVTPSTASLQDLWLQGGFPKSLLTSLPKSLRWRENFIRTFIERDLPQFGFRTPSAPLHRFIQMMAHVHGQLSNTANLAKSLGVSATTINHYISLLEDTYILRTVPPYESTVKKRLVKSPKRYFRDTGILHSLLGIDTMNTLLGHPIYGFSWEGFVIETLVRAIPGTKPYFYRSSGGAEIDLILEKGQHRIAIEIKASSAPSIGKGFYAALDDLDIKEAYVVAQVTSAYPIKSNITVLPLDQLVDHLQSQKGAPI